MKKAFLSIIVVLLTFSAFAQDRRLNTQRGQAPNNGINNGQYQDDDQRSVIDNRPKPPISDYKIISVKGDTAFVDTTLTIRKAYAWNYLRKDDFGLLPFSNVGEPYTTLVPDFDKIGTLPLFGARAKHFAFLDVDDIHYYNVPTPYTDLFFKTTFNRGQLLDAFFTSNISPQFNFSIAYKGLHSLGKYRHILTSQGSFRTTVAYKSKNNRYHLQSHFISQGLSTEQNGGLTSLADKQFKSKSSAYNDRSILDVKFEDAENKLLAKRFFVKHDYAFIQGNDSTANNEVRLGHIFNFSDQEYTYKQDKAFPAFGSAYQNADLHDLTEFQEMSNTLYAQYQNRLLGKVQFRVKHTHYNYGYNRRLNLYNEIIPNRLKGNIYAVGASYEKNIGGFQVSGDAMLNVAGDFNGNYINASAGYELDSLNSVQAGIRIDSRQPNYNFLLYQSDYTNYNWYHEYDNVQRQTLHFELRTKKLLNLDADLTRVHNYTYFGLRQNPTLPAEADSLVTPYQYDKDLAYFKIKAQREFNLGKFALDNTLLYQKALKGGEVFRVPTFVTRNALYYKDYWFHRNLYLQTGFIFNYFTSYTADAYDPVMAEFFVQDYEELKGFPRLDLFFNAKVRTARIYFKLENFTTLFNGNGHYAAPYHPYRDWVIRFGLTWDFFL